MPKSGIRSRRTCAVLLLAVGSCAGAAKAQTREWLNPAGGAWESDANWLGGDQPDTPLESARIQLGGPYTVTLNASRNILDLELLSPGSTLALTGAQLQMEGSYTQDGMTVTGAGGAEILVQGQTTFRNATINGLGSFTANGNLLIDGPGDTRILNTFMTHNGPSGTWRGTGNIVMGGAFSGFLINGSTALTITNNQTASWDNTGVRPNLINAGSLTKNTGVGVTSFQGIALNNTGTVRAATGTLRFDTVSNVTGSILSGGTWRVDNNATLDLVGRTITVNRATVELNGANSVFAAVDSLTSNDVSGTIRLTGGRIFEAQGSFSNAGRIVLGTGGVLRVNDGSAFSLNNGSVNGAGATSLLVSEGQTDLQGGSFNNMTLRSMGNLRIRSGVPLLVDDTCFDHSGFGADWEGTGPIIVGGGSVISFGGGSTVGFSNQQTMSWTGTGVQPTLNIGGTLVKSAAGTTTSILGVEFGNAGTVTVGGGTLLTDNVQNVKGGVLSGGNWEVMNNGELDFANQGVTTNQANVTLDGANATFDAINSLANNDAGARFDIKNGKNFTTTGDFTNNGTVGVSATTGPSTFKINPGSTLTNYNPATRTITGGTFVVQGSGRESGTVEIDGLDVATLAAAVTLDGPGASIIDPTQPGEQNALRNLSLVDNSGAIEIANGKNFDTQADLSVAGKGRLGVGRDSTFNVTGNLGNFDSAGRFSDGSFALGGALRSDNALLVTLATTLSLEAGGRLERPDGAGGFIDALPTLAAIAPEGDLTLRNGRSLTLLPHDLLTAPGSMLTIGPANVTGDTFLEVNGVTTHEGTLRLTGGGFFRSDGDFINNGLIRGSGAIELSPGSRFVNNGVVEPGDSPGAVELMGDMLVTDTCEFRMEIAGLGGPGIGHDVVRIDGSMVFGQGAAGSLVVTVSPDYAPTPGDTFELFSYTGGAQGWFEQVTIDPMFIRVFEPGRFMLVVVPAPGATGLLLIGGLLVTRRRRTP